MRDFSRSSLVAAALLGALAACGTPPTGSNDAQTRKAPPILSANEDVMVPAPGGMRHQSCVHEIENGSKVINNTTVVRPDGSSYEVAPCAYGPKSSTGTHGVIAQDNLPNGAVVEWTDYTLPSPRVYHSLFASWVVPDAPTSGYTASQTYFQYPALKVNDGWILQPVLIWGNGHQYYYYASYYCQISGTCFKVSSSLRASVYDLMNGTITFQGCVGTACTWKVETWDVTAGVNGKVSFSVVLQGNDPGTYNVAQGNAVETYNLQACTQYPLDGVQTTNLVMTDDQGNNVTPTWAPHVASGITPACQFTAPPVTAGIITLHHNVTTAISGPASPNTGSIATYTATGLGPSGHYFQWYRNDSLLSGQTASTLTFVPKLPIPFKLALKTTHVHTGVVDSIVGNYVGNFSLTINGPLTVHVGSSSCTWTVTHQGGISPLTYSWQWQGVDVSTTSSFSQDMSGYTAGSNFSLAVMVTDSTGTPRSLAKTVSVVSTGGTTCMG